MKLRTSAHRSAAGFTLYEIMLTIAVAGVLMAIAIPNMRDFARNGRLTSASNDLLRSIQTGRSEAIKRQLNVLVCATANPSAASPVCSYGAFRGWIVCTDANSNWQCDSGEPILERHDVVDTTVTVRNDNDGIVSYAPSGFANPAGAKTPSRNIVICDARGNQAIGTDSTARAVLVDVTGRARVTKTQTQIATAIGLAGACP